MELKKVKLDRSSNLQNAKPVYYKGPFKLNYELQMSLYFGAAYNQPLGAESAKMTEEDCFSQCLRKDETTKNCIEKDLDQSTFSADVIYLEITSFILFLKR